MYLRAKADLVSYVEGLAAGLGIDASIYELELATFQFIKSTAGAGGAGNEQYPD